MSQRNVSTAKVVLESRAGEDLELGPLPVAPKRLEEEAVAGENEKMPREGLLPKGPADDSRPEGAVEVLPRAEAPPP